VPAKACHTLASTIPSSPGRKNQKKSHLYRPGETEVAENQDIGASAVSGPELARRLGQSVCPAMCSSQAAVGTQALFTLRTKNRIRQFPAALPTVIKVRQAHFSISSNLILDPK
jgi:hypothetical protein